MVFAVYEPPTASAGKVPVLYYLSGLTCTDENFMTKAGAQRKSAELGVALVAPDTSPRGLGVPGESDSWDFGVGAGFYLNATEEPWKNWRMYDYVVNELPALIAAQFPKLDTSKASIMGHSMGGHGAIVIALKNPTLYKSVSAFSPICNPMVVPWGVKAFTGYLGENIDNWKQYDATELMATYVGETLPLLVDVGTADPFLEAQLKPAALKAACDKVNYTSTFRLQEGYDHSYNFIATFIDDHIAHHAKYLLEYYTFA